MTGMSSRTAASGGTRSAGTGPAGVGASVGSAVGLGGRLLGPVVGEAPGVDVGGDAAGSGVARSTITSPVAAAVVPRTPKITPVPSATTATRTLEMPAVASALDGLSRDARPWRMGSSIQRRLASARTNVSATSPSRTGQGSSLLRPQRAARVAASAIGTASRRCRRSSASAGSRPAVRAGSAVAAGHRRSPMQPRSRAAARPCPGRGRRVEDDATDRDQR